MPDVSTLPPLLTPGKKMTLKNSTRLRSILQGTQVQTLLPPCNSTRMKKDGLGTIQVMSKLMLHYQIILLREKKV